MEHYKDDAGVVFGDAEMKENTSGEFLQAFNSVGDGLDFGHAFYWETD